METSLIMKPTMPTTAIPNEQIFIDCQSSDLPGFVANFSNRLADCRNDLRPKVDRTSKHKF